MNDDRPTLLDLFSGIGGFSLAFEAEGFRTIGFSEIDPYASAVLKKHWPGVPNYGDVRTIPPVQCDVVAGGFPCQPFSVAGHRRGEADDRNLWPAMLDVIERCQPAYVVGENVPNIANMVLSKCCDELESRGYIAQPFDIPACAVGLPTVERHVWIVAQANRVGQQGQRKRQVPDFSDIPRKLSGSNQGVGGRWNLPAARVCGVGERVPNRMERLKRVGNAFNPQVAQIFARAIYQQLAPVKELHE